MPSTLQCTGPAHLWVVCPRSASGNVPMYLGTANESPRIVLSRLFRGVQNDIAGDVPMDLSFQGTQGLISADLSRWDNASYQAVACFPHAAAIGAGVDDLGDIGTLMVTEGAALTVYVQFPYAAKAAMAANFMPRCYRFPYCMPVGPDDLKSMGTRPRIIGLSFLAIRGYDPTTGRQLLYDFNDSALDGRTTT